MKLRFEQLERRDLLTGDLIYVSSTSGGTVDGIDFGDEDILKYDIAADTWEMHFDGSDVGLMRADIDAFHLMDDDSFLFSIDRGRRLPGLGRVDNADIIRFVPTSLGDDTAGTLSPYFIGADHGLTRRGENIDAISMDAAGRLIISTTGRFSVDALGGGELDGDDTDLIAYEAGGFTTYFDGSDNDLQKGREDVDAAAVDDLMFYFNTRNRYSVPGLEGDGSDILGFDGSISKVFDFDDARFGNEKIDGMSVGSDAEADLSITKVDDVDPVLGGDLLTYTIEVTNDGPDAAENVVVEDTLPAGATFESSAGCVSESFTAGVHTCDLGDLAAADMISYTLTIRVDAGDVGSTILNEATVTSDTADPELGNNSTSEETEVVACELMLFPNPIPISTIGTFFGVTAPGFDMAEVNLSDESIFVPVILASPDAQGRRTFFHDVQIPASRTYTMNVTNSTTLATGSCSVDVIAFTP